MFLLISICVVIAKGSVVGERGLGTTKALESWQQWAGLYL